MLKFKCAASFLLILCSLTISQSSDKLATTTIYISPKVRIEAELAYTEETREKGLMFRESIPEDAGMLFIFPGMDYYTFWMKNTFIPLDLLWLNERKEIVYFVTADPCKADPCGSFEPMQKAKYVLEVNAGFAKRHDLKLGTRLEFSLPPEVERIANRRAGFL